MKTLRKRAGRALAISLLLTLGAYLLYAMAIFGFAVAVVRGVAFGVVWIVTYALAATAVLLAERMWIRKALRYVDADEKGVYEKSLVTHQITASIAAEDVCRVETFERKGRPYYRVTGYAPDKDGARKEISLVDERGRELTMKLRAYYASFTQK